MRSTICISLLALLPAGAGAEPLCLTLDRESDWLRQPGRTIAALDARLEVTGPGRAELRLQARFGGDGPEAPGALAGVAYRQSFDCAEGPAEEFGHGLGIWVMRGGWICLPGCGPGRLQLRQAEDGIALWTDGLALTAEGGEGCGQPLTTRGNVAVGYLLYETATDACAFADR